MSLVLPSDVYRLMRDVSDLQSAVAACLSYRDAEAAAVFERFADRWGSDLAAEVVCDCLDEVVADQASVDRAVLAMLARSGDDRVRSLTSMVELRRSAASTAAPTPPCR